MGMKEYFTPEEWQNLVDLPYAVSTTVMMAAPNIMGFWGETKAMLQEPAGLAAASGASLVALVSAEMQARAKDLVQAQQNAWKNDQAGYSTRVLDAARAAATALARVPPEEALAYKQWVLAIGTRVAEASKEKGVPVSEQEQAALSGISDALGIGMP